MWAKNIIAALRTIWGSKSLGVGPIEKPLEIADYVSCKHTKNNITNY
jgi:hypothetical protein